MPNATHAIMQLNRLGYLRCYKKCNNLITCFETRIQICIEIQCSLNDAPSPVYTRQMNDANMKA